MITTEYFSSSEKSSDDFLILNNCGEQYLNDRDYSTLRQNGRIDYSLYYIAQGKGYYEDCDTIKEIPTGSILLYSPNVPQHYFFKKQDSTVLLWCHFTGKLCEKLNNIQNATQPITIINKKEFEYVFRNMISANNIKEPQYEIATTGYMTVLLSFVLKNIKNDNSKLIKSKHRVIEAVINDMYLNYRNPIDLNVYAEKCCVSKSRFMHIFKEHTGVSPYHFQLNIRIERAIELLQFGNISVSECAFNVGFNDCSYFCRIFKKKTGHTPKQYMIGIK